MAKRVLLLANLGSPNSTQVRDVRKYLSEFLMDERVIDIPYLARLFLVRGIIVPFRAPKSAAKYKTIWSDKGSPLICISNDLAKALHQKTGMPVYVSMRYANPTPEFALKAIQKEHPDCAEVILLPLYPHYAMSSYETAVEHVKQAWRKGKYGFELEVVKPFYKHPAYIKALANSIRPYLLQDFDHVLFSFHGIPERHITKMDPTQNHCLKCDHCCETPAQVHQVCYRHQISETTRLTAEELQLPKGKYSFAFQSRLGRDKWLQPYSSVQFQSFPAAGIKKILVISPAFVSDCLETLEEIQMEGRDTFMQAGGQEFITVPCLNTHPDWVAGIQILIREL